MGPNSDSTRSEAATGADTVSCRRTGSAPGRVRLGPAEETDPRDKRPVSAVWGALEPIAKQDVSGQRTKSRRAKRTWSRYAERHRYVTIEDDPLLPNSRRGRVKVYRRGEHAGPGPYRFVLNWYEDGQSRKRSVLGDKFNAVAEADRINRRLEQLGRSGWPRKSLSVSELIDLFRDHLDARADAGEISPKTSTRYCNALLHLQRFVETKSGTSLIRAGEINERFVLQLTAYLRTAQVRPNGHPNTQPVPMTDTGVRFVLSVARAAWQWALDRCPPLLPEGTHNPFRGRVGATAPTDLMARPGLDTEGIIQLLATCDRYQLTILLPMVLYGLRAAEPCYVLIEHWHQREQTLTVGGIAELGYATKGKIDKSFPVPRVLHDVLTATRDQRSGGSLFLSRARFEGRIPLPPALATRQDLIDETRRRTSGRPSAPERLRALQGVFRDAGAVTYDELSNEFRKATRQAGLVDRPTLKSLRHHFAAALEASNVSFFTRKYLMGHRISRDALTNYTTINWNHVRSEFDRLLEGPMATIVETARRRMTTLGITRTKDTDAA